MPGGDRVGEAYIDIHVNAAPGEAELAALKAKVDRDFEELGRKKAEAELKLKSGEFDAKIRDAKKQLDYFKRRRADATLDLAKKHFDAQIAEAKRELAALDRKRATVRVDSTQLRRANTEQRLLTKARQLDERHALQQANIERRVSQERSKAVTDTIRTRAEIAKLSETYEKLRGRQVALEKSSRRVFSSGSIAKAEAEARKLERVASEADYVKHRIEQLGGSVEHLDPQIGRNTSMLDRWLSRLGDTSVRIGPITTSIKGLATGLGLLGPLVFELGGGLVSLVGTLGEGLVGAATVGAGALGGLATSALGVGLIIKPMVSEFKEVTKASTALHSAVLKYGKGSEQAKTAQERLNNELHGVSPIAKDAFKSYGGLKDRWRELTKAARPAVFTAFGESLKTVQSLLPSFASESTKTTQVAAKAWDGWMKSLRSSEAKKLLGAIMSDFRASIPGLSSGIGSLVALLGRLSAAGAHFLPGLSHGFAEWANNLEAAVGGGQRLQSNVGSLVNQMQDFGHLTQHTGSLLVHIFDASANSGDGLVKSLDKVIQRWDRWTQSASGKAGLNEFFSDSKTATEDFGSSIAHMTKLLFEFSRATAPVANGLLKVVTWIGDIVSAADGLVGVKQVFQGIGIVLAGLWVASKVLTYADAIGTVVGRLGTMVGVGTAAAGATEAEAAAASEAAIALEAEAAAAAQADIALGVSGLVSSSTAATTALEGTTGSAGLLGGALGTLAIAAIPVAITALGAYEIATGSMKETSDEFRASSEALGDAIRNNINSQGGIDTRLIDARKKDAAATDALSKAEHKLQADRKKLGAGAPQVVKDEQAVAKASEKVSASWDQQLKLYDKRKQRISAAVKAGKNELTLAQAAIAVGGKTADNMRNLARAEADLALAIKHRALSNLNGERIAKGLIPLNNKLAGSYAKLKEAIGTAAAKKVGHFVDPHDVQQVTNLSNRLTRLGQGAAVKNIDVNSKGADETIAKLQRLQRQTARVRDTAATVKIGANDTNARTRLNRVSALSQKLAGAGPTVRILANADNAEQAIHRLSSHLKNLALQHYEAKLDAIDNTKGKSDAAKKHLREVAGGRYTAEIKAVDNASSKAKAASAAIKRYELLHPHLELKATNAQAMDTVQQTIEAINSIPSKVHPTPVIVPVTFRATNSPPSGHYAGGPAAYMVPFAAGGLNDRELQRANEKAIRQQAGPSRKVTRPTMLVGEQAPRHPEYVIATNPAFRSDNERYLDQAAGDLGYEVVPAYKQGKGGSKKGSGKASSGKKGSGPGTRPPKGMHKAHWYLHHEAFAPHSEHQINVKEHQIEELEGQYSAEERKEQYELQHGARTQWDLAWFRAKLEAERSLNLEINQQLIPESEAAAKKERDSANYVLHGAASLGRVKDAQKRAAAADKEYSSAHQGKNESDAAYRKRKAGLKATKTKADEDYKKLKEERAHAKKIMQEANEALDELRHNKRTGAIADLEAQQDINEVLAGEVGGTTAESYLQEQLIEESDAFKRAKADLVDAGLRGDTAGQEAARQHMIEITEGEYAQAKNTPSPEDDISIGERLKQLREETKDNGGKGTIGEQTSSLNEAREQLYQQFASNIVGQIMPVAGAGLAALYSMGASGGPPSYAPGGATSLAAATPAMQAGTSAASGGKKIEVVNNFAAPPPDPHTWTRQQEFELGALV